MKKKLFMCVTAMAVSASLLAGCASGTSSDKDTSSAGTSSVESTSSVAASSSTSQEDVSADSEQAEENEDIIYIANDSLKENLPDEVPSASEDFYLSVNYDYIKDTEIPEGCRAISPSGTVEMNIQKEMKDLLMGDNTGDEKAEKLSIMYQKYADTDSRNATGWDSVKPYVEAIEQAETADDLIHIIDADISHWNLYKLFDVSISVDVNDSSQTVIGLFTPELSLGDSSEYSDMTDAGKESKEQYDELYTKLLKKYGYSDDEIQTMLAEQYSWEKKIAQYKPSAYGMSSVELGNAQNNMMTGEEVLELAGDFPMEELLTNLGAYGKENYMVACPDFIKALPTLVTDENLSEIKAYLILHALTTACQYTDEEAYGYYNDYLNGINGTTGLISVDEQAFDFISDLLQELTGDVYADAFYDDSSKDDVLEIVENVKAALRSRLENNTWLSDETKENALEKLDAIKIYIGSPEVDYYDYTAITPDAGQDLFANYLIVSSELTAQDYANAGKEWNKDAWGIQMASFSSNALYEASVNSVFIPAASLVEPCYSEDYTDEQNYGAIGAVVGHELTHAFDTNGCQFDKDGNEVNWWTDEDSATFAELTQKVSERYGSYCIDGEQLSGDMTVTETVADLGGVASALDALAVLHADDPDQIDYAEFFTINAEYWAWIDASKESAAKIMQENNHAPCFMRANVNLTQFDEFYEAFGVKEGDAMYTAPEDRLSVW